MMNAPDPSRLALSEAERRGPLSRAAGGAGRSRRTKRLVALGALAAALTSAVAWGVGTRRFQLRTQADFEGGDLQGVAVDSRGEVRAGFDLGSVPLPESTGIWDLLVEPDGAALLATGNGGKLLSVRDGAVTELADTDAMVLTSLARTASSAVLVGSMPGGRLFRWADKKLTELVKLPEGENIWDVVFSPKASAAFVATGPKGKIYRVDANGRADVYYDAEQSDVISLAVDSQGVLYAGTGEKGLLYRVESPGRATVLYDFGMTEVRALAVASDNAVYAIANTLKLRDKSAQPSGEEPPGPASVPGDTKGNGALYRFSPTGTPLALLKDADDYFVSLALDDAEHPHVGTGREGGVYSVDPATLDHALVADVKERMVSALALKGPHRFIGASDPGVLHPIRGVGGPDAVWTSKVLDAGLRAKFGRMSWTSTGALAFSTRSGETKEPDSTWSAWSADLIEPARLTSPPGRFLQVRARWSRAPGARLLDLTIPFLTENLRPVLLTVKASGGPSLETGIQPSGGPIEGSPTSQLKLEWSVDNPDQDALQYFVDYQLRGTSLWTPLVKPGEKVTEGSYRWETSAFPEGEYRVRVRVTDAPSNPPESVLTDELTSGAVWVDNTAPVLTELRAEGRRVTGVATDGVGPIERIELSVAGTDVWVPVLPVGGLFEGATARFDADLSTLVPSGPALIAVRAYDRAKNSVVRSVQLK